MLQLANIVGELTGSRSRIVHRPLPQDDPRQRQPDICKGAGDPWLEADHAAQRGAGENDRLFRGAATASRALWRLSATAGVQGLFNLHLNFKAHRAPTTA